MVNNTIVSNAIRCAVHEPDCDCNDFHHIHCIPVRNDAGDAVMTLQQAAEVIVCAEADLRAVAVGLLQMGADWAAVRWESRHKICFKVED